MKEILYILIVFALFMGIVYAYAIYATKNGKSTDENNNFIPDSWERFFKWVFQAKVFIMFGLGFAIGFLICKIYFITFH
ncbi:hypothetical protein OAC51_01105 [Flavobacteriaceae bacterium]|nr:hypothetical protein [Flavobacteriaceae bacterium]